MPSVKAIACLSLFTFALSTPSILAQDRTVPPPAPPAAPAANGNSTAPGNVDTPQRPKRNPDSASPDHRRVHKDDQDGQRRRPPGAQPAPPPTTQQPANPG